jgi:membrane protein DedA with SNARE-associated domain
LKINSTSKNIEAVTLEKNKTSPSWIRRKAPQIIAVVLILAVVGYLLFMVLEDIVAGGNGAPLLSTIVAFLGNAKATVSSWGYGGIFGLMLLESSSLPIPSEIVLPFSGYLVSIGQLNFLLTIVVSTVAAVLGSLVDYYIGLKGIETLLKRKILGRTLFSLNQLMVAAKWFNRHGSVMIFAARLVPGLRTLISFPAGAVKMSLPKFIALTTAGCLLWNTLLIYVGYYLGVNWREVAEVSHYVLIAIVATLVVLAVVYLVIRRRRRKALVTVEP